MKKIKPKVQLSAVAFLPGSTFNHRWCCHDDYFITGFGNTPKQAYDNWASKESKRTRVPRRGIWNQQSVLNWYSRGCPTIRSYLGNKQFVSYDVTTDELILRG